MKTALIIVDVQNDFLPAAEGRGEGALSVTDGNDILPVIQHLLDKEAWAWDVVIATQVGFSPGCADAGLSPSPAHLLCV